ncbi:MAG: lysoplasmalogenase [Salaquimonas sp.]
MFNSSLAIILGANLLSLYYAIFWLPKPEQTFRSFLKIAPMLLLILAGIIGNIPVLILAGLVACTIGDYFLSREGEKNFLFGLTAFLIGHIFYIGFFAGSFDQRLLAHRTALETGVILLALIAMVLFRLWPHLNEMKIPVLIYSVTVAAMAFFAKLAEPGLFVLAGIASFVVSDILLANDKFTPLTNTLGRRIMPYAIWILYFIGQSLIVAGFVSQF